MSTLLTSAILDLRFMLLHCRYSSSDAKMKVSESRALLISDNDVSHVALLLCQRLAKQSHNLYYNLHILPDLLQCFLMIFLFETFFMLQLTFAARSFLDILLPTD